MRNYKPTEFVSAMLHATYSTVKSDSKTCKSCGETKEIKYFSKSPKNADGRCMCCKKCRTKTASAVYHKRKAERDFYKSMMPI